MGDEARAEREDERARGGLSPRWLTGLTIVGVALAVLAPWIVIRQIDDGDAGDVRMPTTSTPGEAAAAAANEPVPTDPATPATDADAGEAAADEPDDDSVAAAGDEEDAQATTTVVEQAETADSATSEEATDDTGSTESGSTDGGSTDGEASTDAAPAEDASMDSAPVDAAPAAPPGAPSYPTLSDGSPVPITAIFDGETIVLSGSIPSDAAAQRLAALAIANSSVPDASVADLTTIDPTVPIGIGVRVIEMNSPRFPESSSEITSGHAEQLDRAVAVMSALPNITVLVIGHSDQRGDPERNFELSADRAQAVVDFMALRGIEPSRMSSRGVGADDLLTLNNDEVALALNRRTEFVFYGLLIE